MRIPICVGDDPATVVAANANLVSTCVLNNAANTLVATLTNCTIPANTLVTGTAYKLVVSASNPADASQAKTFQSDITVQTPTLSAFIEGGDR